MAGPLLPGAASAQEGCEFGEDGNDVLRQVTLAGGEAIYYVTRPHFVCTDGVQIWADSAIAHTSSDLAHLIGSVRYVDRARELRADEARYFSNVGRLQAAGHLVIRDRDQGSVVEHGDLVYLRETEFRDRETMTVTTGPDAVRPVATIAAERRGAGGARTTQPIDAPGAEGVYVVEGDEIVLRGGGSLRSIGSVVFRFDSVQAFADTLEHEEATDRVRLTGDARVEAEAYDLAGREIVMTSPGPSSREIRATGEAVLAGEDLLLTAPLIHLFAEDQRLERLVALPAARPDSVGGQQAVAPPADPPAGAPGAPPPPEPAAGRPAEQAPTILATDRPHAVADRFEITADSLEVLAPGETLERIFAAGRARSVSNARDSLNVPSMPDIARSDWLEGDTIIVTFMPDTARVLLTEAALDSAEVDAAPPASTEEPGSRIERIVALVSARSLYRLPPSRPGSPASAEGAGQGVEEGPPAVHYVVGDRITVVMGEGDVDRLEVEGQAVGVHLEPLAAPGSAPQGATPPQAPGTGPPVAPPDTTGTGSGGRVGTPRSGGGAP